MSRRSRCKPKKERKKAGGDYGTEGMHLGMCFGLLAGSQLENGTGIGISPGMLLGLAIGTCIPKNSEHEEA